MSASRTYDADAILALFPGPATLAISRLRWSAVLANGMVFFAVSVWFLHAGDVSNSERWIAWGALLFGTLVMLMAAIMLLPGAGSLTLDADGFETCSLFRRFRTPWRQVSEFEVGVHPSLSRHRSVIYDDDAKRGAASVAPVRWMVGRNSLLPETYGLSHEDLARLMTQWRARALNLGSRVAHVGQRAAAPDQ